MIHASKYFVVRQAASPGRFCGVLWCPVASCGVLGGHLVRTGVRHQTDVINGYVTSEGTFPLSLENDLNTKINRRIL